MTGGKEAIGSDICDEYLCNCEMMELIRFISRLEE